MGGVRTPLQGETPFKNLWSQLKDGDLWEQFQKAVEAKGAEMGEAEKSQGALDG